MTRKLIGGLIAAILMFGLLTPLMAADADESEREAARKALEAARAELEAARETLREAARAMGEAYGDMEIDTPRAYAYRFMSNPDKAMIGVVLESADGGLKLIGVTPGGPAEEAGLQVGDTIVSINGESVIIDSRGEMSILVDEMDKLESGDEADIVFLRDGKEQEVMVVADHREPFMWHDVIDGEFDVQFSEAMEDMEIRLSEMQAEIPSMSFSFSPEHNVVVDRVLSYTGLHELELVSMNEGLGDYFGTDRGVLVLSAPEENTWGVRSGDVILSIDGTEPSSPSKAWRALRSYEPGESVDLSIMREGTEQTLTAVAPERNAMFERRVNKNIRLHVKEHAETEDD